MIFKIFSLFFLIEFIFGIENKTLYYDSFHGTELSEEEYKERVVKNTTFWCTNAFKACDPHEWRRIDSSCVNLKYPNRGMAHTPPLRLLPASYSGNSTSGYDLRSAKRGGPLPLARRIRTNILPEVREPNHRFTQMMPHFGLILTTDVMSIHDTLNYILWKPYCCTPLGLEDKQCVQVKVPNDDPVHRFGSLRCMKMTKPLTFQSQGCLDDSTVPERVITSSPLLDLSPIYSQNYDDLATRGRLFKGGLLQFDLINGQAWPPTFKSPVNICVMNQLPRETRCHNLPDLITNTIIGINLFTIWFWRMHNFIANALEKVNPCWDDDRLFYTARDINIAVLAQIITYEMLPALMGRENLLRAGLISDSLGFRDEYDEEVIPQVTAEYSIALRWFHITQSNDQKMYDSNGHYLKSIPLTNLTMRTGYLAIDNNMDYITQGAFRQPGARFNGIVDPEFAEIGLGAITEGTDLATFDLIKNRYSGLAPYVKYLETCYGRPFRTFDDLIGIVVPEKLAILKETFKDVEDIDLLVGMWIESPEEGSYLPKTVHCIMLDQHIRFMVMDRHWYERPNRPHALSLEQLLEIRKITMSRMMCDIGDAVTEIQPNSFLVHGPGNEITSCKNIAEIDYEAWRDPSCNRVNSSYPRGWYYKTPFIRV